MWLHLWLDEIADLCLELAGDCFRKHFQLLGLVIDLLLNGVSESDNLIVNHFFWLLNALQTLNGDLVLVPYWLNNLLLECLPFELIAVFPLLNLVHATVHIVNALIESLLYMSVQFDSVSDLLVWQLLDLLNKYLLRWLLRDTDTTIFRSLNLFFVRWTFAFTWPRYVLRVLI